MACGSCKTCVARCSNHPVSCGHAPSQRPSPMISQKLSEPLHNLPMKPEPALADLHRIPDATPGGGPWTSGTGPGVAVSNGTEYGPAPSTAALKMASSPLLTLSVSPSSSSASG